MQILILGAGQVGGILADSLAKERFDVTLVDKDASRLKEVGERLDIKTIHGEASHPDVLRRAGAEEADILVATTGSDEVNIVACQVCYTKFQTAKRIARLRAAAYADDNALFGEDHVPIDFIINPERAVTNQVKELLAHPGALEILDFAQGKVQLAAMKAYSGGPLVGRALRYLTSDIPEVETRVAAIFRKGNAIIPTGDTVIEEDDEAFFIAAREDITSVMGELRRAEQPNKKVVIAGGGNIGYGLAKAIEEDYDIKIVERDISRANWLEDGLSRSIVINGSATDKDMLIEENIDQCDAFCAVTNDDDINIMSSLMAKRLGVKQVITLIGKRAYVDLMHDSPSIDVVISPQQVATSMLLSHVRRADIARVHSLRRGAAEAIEVVAHGTEESSKVVGRRISDIYLPSGTTIGAIVREKDVLIAHDEVLVQADDHVILFVVDKKQITSIEKLFQVGLKLL